ncbi:MAG: BREX-1 system adenine-specific DNA-methyltransferase PglX [Thermoanaerobaculia bacterium]
MEKTRRDALRAVVNKARREVEENLERQLAAFGLSREGAPIAHEELTLRSDQEVLYPRLLDAVRRHGRAVGAEGRITPQAVNRFIRETGGTWINRLAALRALEARGLLDPPAAFISEQYGGMSPRAERIREAAASRGESMRRDDAIRAGLEDACRELTADVRVLFDLTDEQSLFWPDTLALKAILGLFSDDVPLEDWREPDVLGWVYQYYNTEANAELKKRKTATKDFQYTADDIPIANQFYTPHWVVRVLTDNTLGRLWLEGRERVPLMEAIADGREGADRSKPTYHLLERRHGIPHAVEAPTAFREWVNGQPDPLADETVDRLCRFLVPLPSKPLPRPRKAARDLRVIDPACGSGHFLLYAFDVLFAIYREDEPDLDPREIPALILQNNLFGIDIDLRAAQLAAFDLYLKARETLYAIDRNAPLKLSRLNIVIADAHIGDDPRKAEFLARYKDDPEIQQLYAKILEALDNTNALGSLIKVRTEFEGLFRGARESRAKQRKGQEAAWGTKAQMTLVDAAPQTAFEERFRSYSGREWSLGELLEELRAFESEVAPGQDIGARLFYTDLERSVGLLSLLSEQYDVVLMNPPYGDMPPEAKDYCEGNRKKKVAARYPRTHVDLYAAFMEQSFDILSPNGFLGALVPWTYTYLSTLKAIRTEVLCGEARPEFLQEYGYGILDGATVGTVGTVARKLTPATATDALDHVCAFERLSGKKRDWEKEEAFRSTLPTFAASGPSYSIEWFTAQLRSLQDVPGMPYAFWASDSLRALYRQLPPLDVEQKGVLVSGRPTTKIADVRVGLQTSDDPRFLRYWWEVPQDSVGQGRRWVPFVKGGKQVRFHTRVDLVVNWENDGEEVKAWASSRGDHWTKTVRSPDFYFRPGITWPPASWRLRRFGLFEAGHVFGHNGCSIFPRSFSPATLLGFLNSAVGTALMLLQTPERKWEAGGVGALPMAASASGDDLIQEATIALVDVNRQPHREDETCIEFDLPAVLSLVRALPPEAPPLNLADLLAGADARDSARRVELNRRLDALDEAVYSRYKTSADDRVLIAAELGRRSGSSLIESSEADSPEDEADDLADGEEGTGEAGGVEPQTASDLASPLRARDLVARALSYYVKQTIEADEDGIVPVASTGLEPSLLYRLRETMAKDLGKERAQAIEAQAPAFLGAKSLDEWLSISRDEIVEIGGSTSKHPAGFFPWHVRLYRNRPIFWLLSSEGFERGKVRFTFRAYIHYLKLTPDTLPKLLSHYLENDISAANHAWRDASAKADILERRARAAAEREANEWLQTLDALRKFEAAIREVIAGPERAERIPSGARWRPRTIAQVRGGQDLDHGYQPDVELGVRVNITPLAEKRLLPKIVLKKLGG